MAILFQTGLISKPTYAFTTSEKIFQKRFECYQQFRQPPLLTYNDFENGTDFSAVSTFDLIASSSDCFKQCRIILDTILKSIERKKTLSSSLMTKDEAMSITKVCIANSLFLLKVSKYIDNGENESVEVSIDLKTHRQFCTITL